VMGTIGELFVLVFLSFELVFLFFLNMIATVMDIDGTISLNSMNQCLSSSITMRMIYYFPRPNSLWRWNNLYWWGLYFLDGSISKLRWSILNFFFLWDGSCWWIDGDGGPWVVLFGVLVIGFSWRIYFGVSMYFLLFGFVGLSGWLCVVDLGGVGDPWGVDDFELALWNFDSFNSWWWLCGFNSDGRVILFCLECWSMRGGDIWDLDRWNQLFFCLGFSLEPSFYRLLLLDGRCWVVSEFLWRNFYGELVNEIKGRFVVV
jgi:hypothetical protein